MKNFWIIFIFALLFVIIVLLMNKKKGQTKQPDTMQELYDYTVYIDGMSCEHCKARVESAFNEKKGCRVEVNLAENYVVLHSTKAISEKEIKETIASLGFTFVRMQ